MCKLLDEPQRVGSPRDRQIEDWRRFFKYDKQGHKFIILEVYANSTPKEDGRSKGNKSIYIEYTSSLLLNELPVHAFIASANERNFIELTDKEIKLIIGLCNQYYIDENENMFESLYSNKIITEFDKNDFYSRATSKHNEIIESTFKHLTKNNKCLEINKIYKISEKRSNRISSSTRAASNYEENIINRVNNLVLNEFIDKDKTIVNMRSIHNRKMQKKFYNRANEILLKEYNWSVDYKTNKIVFNDDIIIDESRYILTEYEQIEYLAIVNKAVHDFLDTQAENKIIKQEEKRDAYYAKYDTNKNKSYDKHDKNRFAPPFPFPPPYEGFILHNFYVENQKYLSDLLIKLQD
ncbi:hypothetical protein B0F88_112109 [Methylobacter tundripaludum]|uniref:Uncharacterized protein n=2 Tax=Methylobacter tundripaludum TaxID=173365 RepID=A0A2S6GSX1_9GAMM|nr:hypothetical protein B0F88_112109 [Methylobacter tundripaludum]